MYHIPKLVIASLGLHYDFQTAINLKNVSTLWHFYCSPMTVFVLWLWNMNHHRVNLWI